MHSSLLLNRLLIGIGISAVIAATLAAQSATEGVTLAVQGRSNTAPWIAASGSTVAVAWGAAVDGQSDVFVAISDDGGRRFSAPVQVNVIAGEARVGGELPPRVALRARQGQRPEVLVMWTSRGQTTEIKLARSDAGGRSFAVPVTLQSRRAAGDRGWAALELDRAGTAHVVWLDHRGLAADTNNPHAGHKAGGEYDGIAMAQKSGLYYASSGRSAARERELTPGVCYCCKTALVADASGTLFAAWRHVFPGNLRDIAFTVSRDGGRTFSAPARVSEDRWQLNGCPDDGPAMAVDAAGAVHVVWPTVLPGPEPQGALFYAFARDGRSFTPRVRVPTLGSPKPSHPQIVADSHGRIAIAWDEVVNGTRVAAMRAVIRGAGNDVSFGDTIRLDGEGPSTYPVLAAPTDGMVAAWTAGAPGKTVIRVRRVS